MTETTHDLSAIVKANDIRGVAGEQLTVEIARALGAAFADLLEEPELIVAHDMRLSSPELSRAVIEGAVRRGAIVADAGLSSTDQLYCASGLHRAAGLMITASHNPARDNGMKLCLPGARPVGRDSGLEEVRRGAEAYLAAGEIPVRGEGRSERIDTLEDYARTLHGLVDLPAGRRLRVVVDAADAMAARLFADLADRTVEAGKAAGLDHYNIVSVNNSMSAEWGSLCEASACGRKRGSAMANANGASIGADKSGITALLNSMSKFDNTKHVGVINNVRFTKELFSGSMDKVGAVLKAFYENGGVQTNLCVIGRDDLENAMAHPENYQNLLVRIGGFSARFVTLNPVVQREIIERTTYGA